MSVFIRLVELWLSDLECDRVDLSLKDRGQQCHRSCLFARWFSPISATIAVMQPSDGRIVMSGTSPSPRFYERRFKNCSGSSSDAGSSGTTMFSRNSSRDRSGDMSSSGIDRMLPSGCCRAAAFGQSSASCSTWTSIRSGPVRERATRTPFSKSDASVICIASIPFAAAILARSGSTDQIQGPSQHTVP